MTYEIPILHVLLYFTGTSILLLRMNLQGVDFNVLDVNWRRYHSKLPL